MALEETRQSSRDIIRFHGAANRPLRFLGNVVTFNCSCVSVSVFGPPVDAQAAPEKRLEDMMRLGELCIEVLQQNDEHHAEVFDLFV